MTTTGRLVAALAAAGLAGCAGATSQAAAPGAATLMGNAPLRETVLCLAEGLERQGYRVLRTDTVDGLVEATKVIDEAATGSDLRLFKQYDRIVFESRKAREMPFTLRVQVQRELRTYAGPRQEYEAGRASAEATARAVGQGCGELS